jgi:hypothetical protein
MILSNITPLFYIEVYLFVFQKDAKWCILLHFGYKICSVKSLNIVWKKHEKMEISILHIYKSNLGPSAPLGHIILIPSRPVFALGGGVRVCVANPRPSTAFRFLILFIQWLHNQLTVGWSRSSKVTVPQLDYYVVCFILWF